MKKTILTAAGLLCLSIGAYAATHSAWSSPIPWDQTTNIETPAVNAAGLATGFTVSPNPASGAQNVSFAIEGRLDAGARGSFKIYGVDGRLIQSFPLSQLSSGVLAWSPVNKNGKPLPAGIYLASLKVGNSRFESKFMLLK